MKIRELAIPGTAIFLAGMLSSTPTLAGGLFLPGSGAISTSRAGAAVASADDGEALSINPAGLAKINGWTITLSATMIQYFMEFQRAGSYDTIADDDQPYEGTPYPTIENAPAPPLGIGAMQPVPVIAVVTDLGGRVGNLRLAAGLYAPNAYPFRDMTGGYVFNGDFAKPPPASRYDILKQEAAVILPSIAASYRIDPKLDIGARLSFGRADLKSTVAIWGTPANVDEAIKHDGTFTADASDGLVPAFGVGVMYRPTPAIELGFHWSSWASIHAEGKATSENGPSVALGMNPVTIGPVARGAARCAEGGTFAEQSVCIDFQLPMTASLGGRYKFLDERGAMKADLELDVGWENWGKVCSKNINGVLDDDSCTSPGEYRVVVDAAVYVDTNADGVVDDSERQLDLRESVVSHRLQDTFAVRLGGSYHIPVAGGENPNRVVLRGGIGYDTAAAQNGWLRADLDGAARVTTTIGAGYRTRRWELNVGGGAILEGSPTNPGAGPGGAECNPTGSQLGCRGDGSENPIADRQGPDPINPILTTDKQLENPVNQGKFKSSYLLLMLGFSTWF